MGRFAKNNRRDASIAYDRTFVGRRLRPDGNMPVSAHREVGLLLKSVLNRISAKPEVHEAVDDIRSELDEWAMREGPAKQLDQEAFNSLYYDTEWTGPYVFIDRQEMVRRLEMAKAIVGNHYPPCFALDAMIGAINKAVTLVGDSEQ